MKKKESNHDVFSMTRFWGMAAAVVVLIVSIAGCSGGNRHLLIHQHRRIRQGQLLQKSPQGEGKAVRPTLRLRWQQGLIPLTAWDPLPAWTREWGSMCLNSW